MKLLDYYLDRRLPIRGITPEQAIDVVDNSLLAMVQDDGRTRYWGYVAGLHQTSPVRPGRRSPRR